MSKVLYPVAAGPRPTQTIGVYHPSDTSLYVESTSDFPPAPNLVTIYNDGNFVTLSYGLINGEHTLSQLEYIEGDSSYEFPEMSFALRTIDKYDFDAIHEAIESYDSSLSDHVNDFNNPHRVTKELVGLGNVDNTSDADKPISDITQAAIDSVSHDISEHIADVDNPHEVTKVQVGLGNVDNTSDLNKPISIAQQYINNAFETSVENISAVAQSVSNALDFHLEDYDNPHQVNKAQVGLGNVDNTSDINKPVSTAQKEYTDLVQSNLTIHEDDKSNPHDVTKAQVGLGNVDNTSDVDKPVSTAQQNEIDRVDGDISLLNTAVNALDTSLDTHIADDHNPHAVTKAQVGLGNADNTSDVNKPVSVAQREAIDEVQTNLDNHEANKSNPHAVTKSQVGLSNADNTSDINKPVSTAQRAAIDTVQSNLDGHVSNTSNPHNVTKAQIGLDNVNNTSDANKPVSTAQRAEIDRIDGDISRLGDAIDAIDTRTIDGVAFDGSISHYAVCSTAANVAAKTVTLDGFSLNVGARVIVQFSNANREANPTLNVSETGAYPIMWKGVNVDATALDASTVYELVYTGESWVIVGNISVNVKKPTIHGFLLDNADSNPQTRITYIGASANLTAEQRMALFTEHNRHCVVKAAKVVGLVDETDWSKFEDGTPSGVTDGFALDGNFMIRHDTLWWRTSMYTPDVGMVEFTWDNPHDDSFVTAHAYADGTIRTELFTGVFEATKSAVGETTNCLRSVYGTDDSYKSETKYHDYDWHNYAKSMGAAEGLSGDDNTYEYEQLVVYGLNIILWTWLYGNTNFQATIGRGICDSSPIKACGAGISLTGGNTQGNTAMNSNVAVVVGGRVNAYGNVFERKSCAVQIYPIVFMAVKGGDYVDFGITTGNPKDDKIRTLSLMPDTWHSTAVNFSYGYITKVSFDKYHFAFPISSNSSTNTTYMADGCSKDVADTSFEVSTVKSVCVGGDYSYQYRVGPYCFVTSPPFHQTSAHGARLQCHGLTPIRP